MDIKTLKQVYYFPISSQNNINNILNILNLSFTTLYVNDKLLCYTIEIPFISVVHMLNGDSIKPLIKEEIEKRIDCPSHLIARKWNIGELEKSYPQDFFSAATRNKISRSITELITQEVIIKKFQEDGITPIKITFNKPVPIDEILGIPHVPYSEEWIVFVEEARLLINDLPKFIKMGEESLIS